MKQTIFVSYKQISVFDPALDNPFNDWSGTHVEQGFSLRPYSVSFATCQDSETELEVVRSDALLVHPDSTRAIVVPFTVPEHGLVAIGSVGDEREVEIGHDTYELLCELGVRENAQWCRLSFVPNAQPTARILKADPELTRTSDLLMTAQPAV